MPITLATALPAAATLGPFVEALPALLALPGVYGIFDAAPSNLTIEGGKISAWTSLGGLGTSFSQSDPTIRPVLDSNGRISMGGNSRLDLAGVGTSGQFTLAFRFDCIFDTGGLQTLFSTTGNSYARSFWSPSLLRTRFGGSPTTQDVAPPPVPTGAVFVINGTACALHAGGQITAWTSDVSSHALVTMLLGAQTTNVTTLDSHLRFSKAAVCKAALTGTNLDNLKAWVGA